VAARHLDRIAPAFEILPYRPHGQLDVELPADQVADRGATPQGRSDPQVFRVVLIEQVLDVAGLRIGKETSRAEGATGAFLRKGIDSPVGVGGPPAANGLAGDPQQVRELGFGQA
jgi:hypothetical protein